MHFRVTAVAISRLVACTSLFLNLLLIGFYIGADQFTGRGITNSVFYQLTLGIQGVSLSQFPILFIGGSLYILISAIVTIVFALYFTQIASRLRLQIGIAIAFIAIIAFNPILHRSIRILSNQFSTKLVYTKTLPNGQIIDYRSFSKTWKSGTPRTPKNLVYIYAESLEANFFNQELFPGLMHDLRPVTARAIQFRNIYSTTGAGWTMGGIVASQCGRPLIVPNGDGNKLNQFDRFMPNAWCISDQLRRSGYNVEFIQGTALAFAG